MEAPPPLIPGLPDDVAEICLLRLPFPSLRAARAVSSAWNRLLSDPTFQLARSPLRAYLFVAAFLRGGPLVWLAFDPLRRRWLPPLPPMPDPPLSPASFSSFPLAGCLFVLDGPRRSLTRFHPHTHRWSPAAPMPTPRASPVLGAVGGRLLAVGGAAAAEAYDPGLDSWTGSGWRGIEDPYDAAVAGGRMYVTEGWRWPFDWSPRGEVYGGDVVAAMGEGMREGWTGASAVVGESVMVVEEWGEGRLKVYRREEDAWTEAEGGGVPRCVGKPVAVCGDEGIVYVVGEGMAVATGRVRKEDEGRWRVEWEVSEGPPDWQELRPCSCHVMYA